MDNLSDFAIPALLIGAAIIGWKYRIRIGLFNPGHQKSGSWSEITDAMSNRPPQVEPPPDEDDLPPDDT